MSSKPKGAVGSSTSPSRRREECLVLLGVSAAQSALRDEVAIGHEARAAALADPPSALAIRPPGFPCWCDRESGDGSASTSSQRWCAGSIGDYSAQQRRLARDPDGRSRGSKRVSNCAATSAGADCRGHFFQRHGHLPQDHLQRFDPTSFQIDGGPQHIVPLDDVMQCRRKLSRRSRLSNPKQERREIRIALRRHQMLEENSFLQRREG